MLLFDLDETLSHYLGTKPPENEADVQLTIKMPTGQEVKAYFNIRPHTHQILKEVNKYYEVGVFTASHKFYADEVLNYIDPTGELIQHRFYRDSCIKTEYEIQYIKDLRIFKNVDLKDIILVDNAVYCFGVQLSNGVPMTPFKEDKSDEEFVSLQNFLVRIHDEPDVRVALRHAFGLEDLFSKEKYNFDGFIEYYDIDACEEEQEQDDEYEEWQRRSDDQMSAGPPSSLQQLTKIQKKKQKKSGKHSERSQPPSNEELNSQLPKSVQDSLDKISQCMSRSA